jgi:hypothetical protein
MIYIFSFFYLLSIFIFRQNSQKSFYSFIDYIPEATYEMYPIPIGAKFTTNNTCITYGELIEYNYSDPYLQWQNWNKVFPENFCYSMLTYNITREDFSDIINKNLRTTK